RLRPPAPPPGGGGTGGPGRPAPPPRAGRAGPPPPPPAGAPPPPQAPGGGAPLPSRAVGAPLEFVSVVIPVFDERDSLRPLAAELLPALRKLGRRYEVIFVDDGSRDGSTEVLADLPAAQPAVPTLPLPRNF